MFRCSISFPRFKKCSIFLSFAVFLVFFFLNSVWEPRPFGERIIIKLQWKVDDNESDINWEKLINPEWNDSIPDELLRFVPKNLSENVDYVMVPNADCAGFGDRDDFETSDGLSAVIESCNKKKNECKAFTFNPEHNTPRNVYTKDWFGVPTSSKYHLYIKKIWIHEYLKVLSVNLKCAECNMTDKHEHQCRLPVIDPWSKDIIHLVPNLPPRKCSKEKLFTELIDNKLRLRDEKRNDSRFLYALAEPILSGGHDDKFIVGQVRNLTLNNSSFSIDNDFWRVTSHLKDGQTSKTWHLSVVEKPEVLQRKPSANPPPLDVYIITFDGTSHAHFRRMMPKSYAFLKDKLKSMIFQGYATVGDATLPNVNAMLTGNPLEESRRIKALNDWPFIFKEFKNAGYVTMMSEDFAILSCFTLTLPGFYDPPTDHYARPIWKSGAVGQCLGGQFQAKLQFDYLKSYMKSYKGQRKFGHILMVDLCHRDTNLISTADEEFYLYLSSLKEQNLLDQSMFMVMADHGPRFGDLRVTHQGKLEERLPLLSVTLPNWFIEKYPEQVANFKRNTELITSPYDLHATFQHLLNFSKPAPKQNLGSSLFGLLPENRLCSDAGITDQWCPCLEWHDVNISHIHIKKAAVQIVSWMNNNLAKNELSKTFCKKIRLNRILTAFGKIPIHSKNTGKKSDRCSYQIQLETMPGHAIFEVMVDIKNTGDYNIYEVSRLNAYGTQAQCIESKVPSVRKYCYCK